MKEENKKMGYCYYWSPIMKLIICFTIPLIFVCGFVSFIGGPNPSNWVFNYHPFSSSAQVSGAKSQVSTKDLRSNFDEVIAEQATTTVTEHSVFSTPPLAIQAASPALPPVSFLTSSLLRLLAFTSFVACRCF